MKGTKTLIVKVLLNSAEQHFFLNLYCEYISLIPGSHNIGRI